MKLYEPAPPIVIWDEPDDLPQRPHGVFQYELTNALANPFGAITHRGRLHTESIYSAHLPLGPSKRLRLLVSNFLKPRVLHDGAALSINNNYGLEFYHFTVECMTKLFVLRHHLVNPNTVIIMPNRLESFHREWFDLFNLSNRLLLVEPTSVVKAKRLITCSPLATSSNQHISVLKGFRQWVLEAVGLASTGPHTKIFIGRKRGSRRNISNLDAVKGVLLRHGYIYLEMDGIGLVDQIRIVQSATHIAGVHGAALSHLMFARQDTKILELIGENVRAHYFQKICLALDLPYSKLRCAGLPSQKHLPAVEADILVDTAELDRLL